MLSDDGKLLRFLLAAAPEMPPVWRGSPVSPDAVLAAARAAAGDDDEAQKWLDSLARDGVLATYGEAGHDALRGLEARWREGWQRFAGYWELAQRAEERWRRAPRDVGGGRAVSFDDLAYVATGRLELPAQREIHGPLLLALHDAEYVPALRDAVNAGLVDIAGRCPWFEALWESAQKESVGVVAAYALLPQAKEDAAAEARREKAAAEARAQDFAAARGEVCARLEEVLMLVPTGDEDLAKETVGRLLETLNGFQAAAQRLLALPDAGVEGEALRRGLEKLASLGFAAQRSLAATEATTGVNAIFYSPRALLGVVAGAVILLIRVPAVLIGLGVVVALVLGYRWYSGFHATERALERLRVFGLSARSFLRGPGGAKGDAPPA